MRARSTCGAPISPTVRCGNARRNCGKLKQANAPRFLTSANYATEGFTQRHEEQILGVMSGFDRMRFRGTLRLLTSVGGMRAFLSAVGVRLKDFMAYAGGDHPAVTEDDGTACGASRASRAISGRHDPEGRAH